MRKKSLNLNMFLYAIDYVVGAIFPLITFPYVSKILGVESLGKYNFSVSVIGYLLLLAKLGISVYAIREGSRIREEKEKFQKFANQMFSINIVSTGIVYILFLLLLFVVPKFSNYQTLMLVLSIQIFFVPITVDWIYKIYEDFLFVTLRNILYQLISISLLFAFVKTKEDLINYAVVTVVSGTGANLFNFICSRKYCKIGLTKELELKQHLYPIVTLFAMTIANKVFDTSDVVMLGFLSDDRAVGIYSVAVKVYSIVKGVAASIVAVSIPRISSLLNGDKSVLKNEAKKIYNTLLSISVPVAVGVIMLAEEIVLIISGEEFLDSVLPLRILAVDILVSVIAYFWGQAILVPFKRDKAVLKIITAAAIINMILNFFLIPVLGEVATALTTLGAECVWMALCKRAGEKEIGKLKSLKQVLKVTVGSIPIVIFALVLKLVISNMYFYIIALMALSGVSYLVIELLLKNDVLYDILIKLKKKLKE